MIQQFIRRSTPVQALELATPDDLAEAVEWMHARKVHAVIQGTTLIAWDRDVRLSAQLGQVLIREPSGGFGVHDRTAFGPGKEFEAGYEGRESA